MIQCSVFDCETTCKDEERDAYFHVSATRCKLCDLTESLKRSEPSYELLTEVRKRVDALGLWSIEWSGKAHF